MLPAYGPAHPPTPMLPAYGPVHLLSLMLLCSPQAYWPAPFPQLGHYYGTMHCSTVSCQVHKPSLTQELVVASGFHACRELWSLRCGSPLAEEEREEELAEELEEGRRRNGSRSWRKRSWRRWVRRSWRRRTGAAPSRPPSIPRVHARTHAVCSGA